MKLVNLYTVKQMILAERDKIPLTVPAAPYELIKEKPYIHGNAMRGGIRIALRCLEAAPAVDAEPVVRCGECVKRYTTDCALHYGATSLGGEETTFYFIDRPNDFWCAYGERKTE